MLVGHPVSQSLSPALQNAALKQRGLALRYETLDVSVSALDATLAELALEGAAGNVTIPHKISVAVRARCTPLAARVGAVNTFWHENGVLHGENTDVAGVSAAVRALCPGGVDGARCAVLGAGGTAAAALIALQQLGCRELIVFARTSTRAHARVNRIGVSATIVESIESAVAMADLVINATPIGMLDEAMPVAARVLAPQAAVLDLVYRVGETAWVRHCRAAGHAAQDGLLTLLEQGATSFECWFGAPAPREAMRRALDVITAGGP